MTNSRFLMMKIAQKDLKLSQVANKLRIPLKVLDMKIHNERAFLVREMQILCDLLGLTDSNEKIRIFFAQDVELGSTVGNKFLHI